VEKSDRSTIVTVSDIVQYLICPRRVYFTSKGYKNRINIENLMLKEIALLITDLDPKDDDDLVERTAERLPLIYMDELKDFSSDQIEEAKMRIRAATDFDKMKKLAVGTYEVNYRMLSARLGLVGCVDELIKIGDEFIPAIIKTGNCPETGVWKRDRLQLAAYAILINESLGATVNRGFVEYVRQGERRETPIRSYDRRKVFMLLDRVKRIKEGALPDRIKNAPCDGCDFHPECETKHSLLSKFF
jgi:CRISPR-associated exonuclease Cas4